MDKRLQGRACVPRFFLPLHAVHLLLARRAGTLSEFWSWTQSLKSRTKHVIFFIIFGLVRRDYDSVKCNIYQFIYQCKQQSN